MRTVYGTLALVTLGLAGCVAVLSGGLQFSHQLHVPDADDPSCDLCHATESIEQGALPDHGACGECHEVEEDSECQQCHPTSGRHRMKRPLRPDLIFSHELHTAMDLACERCHGDVFSSQSVKDSNFPAMKICTECHDGDTAPSECDTCHADLGSEALKPLSHAPSWLRKHRLAAPNFENECRWCHERAFCSDCHEGKISTKFRIGDSGAPIHDRTFRFTHGLEASADPGRCESCHSLGFCSDCHRRI